MPTPPAPQFLEGQAPPGLWDALVGLVAAEGFTLTRGDCRGANGYTDYAVREVRVRADVDDAQAVKTLAHDLLTAPTGPIGLVECWSCSDDTPFVRLLSLLFVGLCWARRHASMKEGVVADGQDLGSVSRDVKRLAVPIVGAVVAVEDVPGTVLLDASGRPVAEVAEFFHSMLASGASTNSLRSYGLALLRWWRFLAAVEVSWDRAGRAEAQDFVLWMRMVGPSGTAGRVRAGNDQPRAGGGEGLLRRPAGRGTGAGGEPDPGRCAS